jgi:L-ribulokinase
MNGNKYTIGLDFGTDSVRAIVIDTASGKELATAVFEYPRWKQGLYCDAKSNRFRQHPQDYIDGMEHCIRECIEIIGHAKAKDIVAIGITTTGSTPVAVNEAGTPLALLDAFSENPNAMFFLWKDHVALREAEEINTAAAAFGAFDYVKYAGGIYSPEWFWSKLLYVLRNDRDVRQHCCSWVEHSDWIPFLLTGKTHVSQLKRNVCAAGHKALWAAEHGGFPSAAFLQSIDPLLEPFAHRITGDVWPADRSAGTIDGNWALRLGLPTDVQVGIGAIDAHVGAVGAQVEPGFLTMIIGTSTCDILVVPKEALRARVIRGICGQVEGSVLPGMIGLEAGQAAFGDLYSWFQKILEWPYRHALLHVFPDASINEMKQQMLRILDEEAAKLKLDENSVIAVDWFNGRRTPDANLELKGALLQLSLGTDTPAIYAALVEASCFGARKIIERFLEEGLKIEGIIGVGGIARKSSFVMQMMADVVNLPIKLSRSEQVCARGAAMLAAVAGGCYATIGEAMNTMGAGFDKTYYPDPEKKKVLDQRYRRYEAACRSIETGASIVTTGGQARRV